MPWPVGVHPGGKLASAGWFHQGSTVLMLVFFFFNLFFIGGELLYSVVLASAKQQCKPALILHISLPS